VISISKINKTLSNHLASRGQFGFDFDGFRNFATLENKSIMSWTIFFVMIGRTKVKFAT